ncbi:uncharacterized protein LOC117112235 [Anneissia japonica]|uniref:uncharacterized protein LOC117112235 n=1 Tax=Anneissia japonica TaxID=1529436 RepID=UPI001425A143|nr:uncharacterized protein LOC117112235 [Anneissia japonica]
MTVHLFGGVWSPSCANFALRRTIEYNASEFHPKVLQTVKTNFYVDDCLKSVPSADEAVYLVHQLKELLLRGGFRLNKWIFNCTEVIYSLLEEEWTKGLKCLNMNFDNLPCERALGMLWNVELDQFQFNIQVEPKPMTRRGLLSIVSFVYDLLGYTGPYVLRAKMLFQQLCRLNYGWDDTIPPEIAEQWGRWLKDIHLMRFVCGAGLVQETLASDTIYGQCILETLVK